MQRIPECQVQDSTFQLLIARLINLAGLRIQNCCQYGGMFISKHQKNHCTLFTSDLVFLGTKTRFFQEL